MPCLSTKSRRRHSDWSNAPLATDRARRPAVDVFAEDGGEPPVSPAARSRAPWFPVSVTQRGPEQSPRVRKDMHLVRAPQLAPAAYRGHPASHPLEQPAPAALTRHPTESVQ